MVIIVIALSAFTVGTLLGMVIGANLVTNPTGRLTARPQVPARASDDALSVVLAYIQRDARGPADRPSETISGKIIRSEITDGRS